MTEAALLRDGEVFDPAGAVTGRSARSTPSGPLR